MLGGQRGNNLRVILCQALIVDKAKLVLEGLLSRFIKPVVHTHLVPIKMACYNDKLIDLHAKQIFKLFQPLNDLPIHRFIRNKLVILSFDFVFDHATHYHRGLAYIAPSIIVPPAGAGGHGH